MTHKMYCNTFVMQLKHPPNSKHLQSIDPLSFKILYDTLHCTLYIVVGNFRGVKIH